MGFRAQGLGLAILAVLALAGAAAAAPACRPDTVHLRGEWGQARFSVELADDAGERSRGLMHRENLPRSAGMLFVYKHPHRVGFWMKNTLIPLDMLFLDETGTVRHIHHEARPLDETPIFGGDDTLAVLEINGGLARQIGITEGSELRHPAFEPDEAAWPCPED
ncbi:DUF192 domain-containing protein [Roseovarius salinarum]|uniref:DUF192 domain-containing protein n=1 Tax=Roseovarius salinarum TaxID=1981892 RepID=UPI000C328464|nr:DUF192 domain-containing protein [Roseovarius salinarum]